MLAQDVVQKFAGNSAEKCGKRNKKGALFANSEIEVIPLYVGSGGTAFTDPVKGREVALSAISRGADVVYHAAGTSGIGVIKAAQEEGVWAIGVDVDQSNVAPEVVATSMLKNFDVAMLYVAERLDQSEKIANTNITLGLANNAVALVPLSEKVAARAGDIVEQAREHLMNSN